jgi:hypothetical protein
MPILTAPEHYITEDVTDMGELVIETYKYMKVC